MVGIFDDMKTSFADILNTSPEAAGFILGFATICVFIIAFLIMLSVLDIQIDPLVMAIPAGIGIAFVGLVEWWPMWAILFIVIILAVILAKPFVSEATG